MEDREIVELFLAGDEEAIRRAAEKYGARLRRLAFNICGDEGVAEECENDAYLRAWELIPPHEPYEYLWSFLARLARFSAIDRSRRLSRQKRSAEYTALTDELESCLSARGNPESELDGAELSRAVSDFLRELPAEKRNIFIRRYWYADSVAEVAERFSLGESKVKSVLHRLRGRLKEYLIKGGYLP